MRMGRLEKFFVNRQGHGASVAREAERRLRRVEPRAGARYLDVGCGTGHAARQVADVFQLRVTGVDVDPAQVEAARAAITPGSTVSFVVADATRLPFDDAEFDIVATNKATHHIPAWQDAVREMIRVLKPGGHLIYSDLVLPRPVAWVARAVAGSRAGFPTRREVQELAAAAHLSPLHVSRSPISLTGTFAKTSPAS